MKLSGSCHCAAVRFEVESPHPYPFNLCYCSICRKTAGGGGYAINLGADFSTLQVQGEENIARYSAKLSDDSAGAKESPGQRSFCRLCGSALWVWERLRELLPPGPKRRQLVRVGRLKVCRALRLPIGRPRPCSYRG